MGEWWRGKEGGQCEVRQGSVCEAFADAEQCQGETQCSRAYVEVERRRERERERREEKGGEKKRSELRLAVSFL